MLPIVLVRTLHFQGLKSQLVYIKRWVPYLQTARGVSALAKLDLRVQMESSELGLHLPFSPLPDALVSGRSTMSIEGPTSPPQ